MSLKNFRALYFPAMSLFACFAIEPVNAQQPTTAEIFPSFAAADRRIEGLSSASLGSLTGAADTEKLSGSNSFSLLAKRSAEAAFQPANDAASPRRRERQLYVHLFRSPSTGLEYRQGNIGIHVGLYTTILGGGKSTEFFKTGLTGYYRLFRNPRFENYFSVGYVRGLNRDYKDRDGLFIESGIRWSLGKQLELRSGIGILASEGRGTRINPTIGLSWNIAL